MTIRGIPYHASTLEFQFDKLSSLNDLQHEGIDRFNRIFEEIEEMAREDMRAEGVEPEHIWMNYEILGRYGGQLWELRAQVPKRRIDSLEDLKSVIKGYESRYREEYGLQAMAPRGGLQIISVAVELIGRTQKPQFFPEKEAGKDPKKALRGERDVYLSGAFRKCKIYTMEALIPGNEVPGPSIIEGIDTSVVIPENRKMVIDKYRNMLMSYR